jgi:hypothetical protein
MKGCQAETFFVLSTVYVLPPTQGSDFISVFYVYRLCFLFLAHKFC